MDYDVLKRDYQTYMDQVGRYNTASNDFNALVAEYNKEIARWNKDKIDFVWDYSSGGNGGNVSRATPEYLYNRLQSKIKPENPNYNQWLVSEMNNLVRTYSPTPNKELWSQEKIPFTWYQGGKSNSSPGAIYESLQKQALKGGWGADYSNWLQKNMESLQDKYYAKPEKMIGPAPNTPNYSVAQQQMLNTGAARASVADTERAGGDGGLIAAMQKQSKPDQSISGLLSGVRRST